MSDVTRVLESWGGALAAWTAGMTLWTGVLLVAALELVLRPRVSASWRMVLPAAAVPRAPGVTRRSAVALAYPAGLPALVAGWARASVARRAASARTRCAAIRGSPPRSRS